MAKQIERIQLTPKDVALFEYLHANKIAMIDQIERDVLPNYGKKTLYWRLKKLERLDLLSGKYSRYHGNKRALSITKKAFDQFVSRGNETRKELTSDAIDHDLRLVEIQLALRRFGKVDSYLTENQLQTWPEHFENMETRPFVECRCDAAIRVGLQNGRYWLPVEYESTAKSRPRYREVFKKYYGSTFPAVLYVCDSDSVKKVLMDEEQKFYRDERPLMYYKILDELLTDTTLTFINRIGKKIQLGEQA